MFTGLNIKFSICDMDLGIFKVGFEGLRVTAVFKKVGTAGYKNRYHKFDLMLGLRSVSVPLLCSRHIMGKNPI